MININLYIYEINDNDTTKVENFFSEYRINKITDNVKKDLLIKTEHLLKITLENEMKKSIDKLNIEVSRKGKIVFTDYPTIHFNISHVDKHIIVAYSSHEVGVDIELITSKHQRLSQRLNESENRSLIKKWTIIESYVKLFGESIFIDYNDLMISKEIIRGPFGSCYYQSFEFEDNMISVSSPKRFNLAKIIVERV
ncbi:MAG: hypothetical protein RBQ97_10760 [Acholeplasma sp.]|nr:hypothetical protein [Acholeplasma sp.]